MKDILRRFMSVDAWVLYGDGPTTPGFEKAGRHRASRSETDYFETGVKSWDGAKRLARRGYDGPRPEVDAITAGIYGDLGGFKDAFAPTWDVAGGMVDVGAFCAGEPEHMVNFELVEEEAPDRVVRILCSNSYNAAQSRPNIIKRGAAVVALTECLTRDGFGVELWAESGTRPGGFSGGGGVHSVLVRVKASDEPLDINAWMLACAHPAAERRLNFAVMEREPIRVCQHFGFGGNYGAAAPPNQLALDAVQPHLVVKPLYQDDSPVRDPKGWLEANLEALRKRKADETAMV